MSADALRVLANATLDDSLPFAEIIGKLVAAGVESYYVKYPGRSFTFYSAAGASVHAPLLLEGLPAIAADFDAAALRAAILDSQQHGEKFRAFCQRAMEAGVQGYFAYLRGQRVTYFGRQGDQHTEWFPGRSPAMTDWPISNSFLPPPFAKAGKAKSRGKTTSADQKSAGSLSCFIYGRDAGTTRQRQRRLPQTASAASLLEEHLATPLRRLAN